MPTNIVFNSSDKKCIYSVNSKTRWLRPKTDIQYRKLTENEINKLKSQGNTAGDWSLIEVGKSFDYSKIWNSHFYGLVRIEALEDAYLEHHNLKLPIGIYDSLIIDSDIGANCVIRNVRYLSHFVIHKECILFNIGEMQTSSTSKFGVGIIKESESEDKRVFIELCNENGGRKVAPFNGMLSSDAYLWSKFRDDKLLMQKFLSFTDKTSSPYLGYYGQVGNRSIIKNCQILKDVLIGSGVYIKGSNKLKNLSINSSIDNPTQIGEGCEMVNGIIGYGCKIFYGVKAVRFIIGDNSSLKYGARLINSLMGENSTVSCCEVLNSLIYPAHEQHHNNSFLISSLIFGQSNIAAGATIGSNHNSRAADGEIIAGRGFWPGLSVSLKHNSKFASFTMIAKALYNYELNIPFPFSLVSNSENALNIMPAYWWMYNAYALKRNEYKCEVRDKRKIKLHNIEYKFLAPDTASEIIESLDILNKIINNNTNKDSSKFQGEQIFKFENSKRPVFILKPNEAVKSYKEMLILFLFESICTYLSTYDSTLDKLICDSKAKKQINIDTKWYNLGGQIFMEKEVSDLKKLIYNNKITCWDDVHKYYNDISVDYSFNKACYAISIAEYFFNKKNDIKLSIIDLQNEATNIIDNFYNNILLSREKDYKLEFRKITYSNNNEMKAVLGNYRYSDFIDYVDSSYSDLKEKIKKLSF